MKARRGMQITVGVLALLVASCLVLFTLACVAFAFIPKLPSAIADLPKQLKNGFVAVADWLTIGSLYYVVPLAAYAFPVLLLVIAAGLLLSKKGKQGKYIAGCVLTLIGVAVIAGFSIVCAKPLLGENAIVLQGSAAGALALTVLFAGLALGLKPKQNPQEELEQAQSSEQKGEQVGATTEEGTEEQPTEQEPVAPYVPQEVSVETAVEEVYGKEEPKRVPDSKLETLKMLLDVGAISEEEYLKLLESYLK